MIDPNATMTSIQLRVSSLDATDEVQTRVIFWVKYHKKTQVYCLMGSGLLKIDNNVTLTFGKLNRTGSSFELSLDTARP
jgi:hypothetical protein